MLHEYTTGRYFRKRQWNKQGKQARYTEEKEKQLGVDPATAIADAGPGSPELSEFIRVAFQHSAKPFWNASTQSDETQYRKEDNNKTDPPDNAVHSEFLRMVKSWAIVGKL